MASSPSKNSYYAMKSASVRRIVQKFQGSNSPKVDRYAAFDAQQ